MHFFMNDVFAAPASALPSLPTALLSQVSCAKAEPIASVAITEARTMLLIIGCPDNRGEANLTAERSCDQAPSAISNAAHLMVRSNRRSTRTVLSLSIDERVTWDVLPLPYGMSYGGLSSGRAIAAIFL